MLILRTKYLLVASRCLSFQSQKREQTLTGLTLRFLFTLIQTYNSVMRQKWQLNEWPVMSLCCADFSGNYNYRGYRATLFLVPNSLVMGVVDFLQKDPSLRNINILLASSVNSSLVDAHDL